MKKVLMSICFMLAAVTMVLAQRAAEKKAEIKKGLKEQVMLTDAQIDTVMSIEDQYRTKSKAVKGDATTSVEDKKSKVKALNQEKHVKLETALGKDLAKKVEAFYTDQKHKPNADGTEKGKKNKKDEKASDN